MMMYAARWLWRGFIFPQCTSILAAFYFYLQYLQYFLLLLFLLCVCVSVRVCTCSPTCIKVDCCEIYCILFGVVWRCTFITLVALSGAPATATQLLLLLLLLFRNRWTIQTTIKCHWILNIAILCTCFKYACACDCGIFMVSGRILSPKKKCD